MAEFAESLKCLSSPLPFIEMDQSFELMSHLAGLSGSFIENPGLGLAGFSNDSYFSPQPNLVLHFADNLLPPEHPKPMKGALPVGSTEQQSSGDKKRKAIATPESDNGNSSATHSESTVGKDTPKERNSSESWKRGRSDSEGAEEPKKVVHVRARRGQATDSHSLAERVRRERINERMRCLKGLVPGCDKVMGMAGMLDEIINYVQSLQNQVEFLSMELSAASSFHDFRLGNGAITPQVISRGDKEQNLPLNMLEDNTIIEIASSIGFSLPSEVEGAKSLLAYIRELERSRAPKS